mgnify:CR=1 FL=1
MSIQHRVADVITQHVSTGNKIILALSGGIDSVVLLDILSRLSLSNNNVVAVHVHHGLSAKADAWLAFCKQLCQQYQIQFFSEHVHLKSLDKGIEAAARQARYQALAKHMERDALLLTAQHQDDQCETLLLALKRGSGVRGLAAMPTTLPFKQGILLRPLLRVPREAIEKYAASKQLRWVEDDSNSETKFDRNFLRLDVLPELNKRWPGFSANVARSAELCQQANYLLDEIAEQDLNAIQLTHDKLCLTLMAGMSPPRINNVLRMWLRQFDLAMPSQQVMEQIVVQMLQAKDDSDPVIALGAFSLRRYKRVLYIVSEERKLIHNTFSWALSHPLSLGEGMGELVATDTKDELALRKPRVEEQVTIRFAIPGATTSWPIGRDKRRTVKKLMQEYHVPTWQRRLVPFVFYGEKLVAAVGLWVDKDYTACAKQQAIKVEHIG